MTRNVFGLIIRHFISNNIEKKCRVAQKQFAIRNFHYKTRKLAEDISLGQLRQAKQTAIIKLMTHEKEKNNVHEIID